MAYANLILSVHERVATITLNRPEKLNALNASTIEELDAVVDDVAHRADAGGVIITGAQRAFVAGADIGELAQLDAAAARRYAERGQAVFARIAALEKPVVAAVNGFALGGGCELALACHVRIASDAARFGQPEVKLGTVPGYGGTQRLPRLVGAGRALELLLTGDMIDAAEALRIGLVNRVVPAAELLGTADALVRRMLANGPLALAACLRSVREGASLDLAEALALEAELFGALAATSDMREGTSAFLAKRPPQFTGR